MKENNTITFIEEEINWFSEILDARLQQYFADQEFDISSIPPPAFHEKPSHYQDFIAKYSMSVEERVILVMSIIPHLNPQLFDRFFIQNKSIGRSFSEFGGYETINFKGFIPTGETVCFVLAGKNLSKRIELIEKFKDNHFFKKENILSLQQTGQLETFWSGKLTISDECLSLLMLGQAYDPEFSSNFPANKISTHLTLSDLVLNDQIMDEVDHMQTWMLHQQEIKSIDYLKKRFRKGYRALFYGPPGTGKTLTASLLGNIHKRSVYRIDLSQIVSKYIGETEKNLSRIFDIAENKDWILFFDEAESLFSKRTDVSDSKDKFANQETSYLLQRIEDFDGMIILATNLKPNIDRAFIRRFQSIIHFTLPMPKERELLWRKALASFNVSTKIDYSDLAKRFEVSGGAINNAVQFAWLNAKRYGQDSIHADNLIHGIMRELGKEGKTSGT
jgi:hypothetical protein